ncbi:MAG: flagellar hook-basal body complex protein [Lachnospiraceae bacterium]|nr:flagellar hook-basal body complex protein [Lachnospiraceae bacterium]
MMRSMYAGVAGLKTHQTKMDVIGNNIANVNTVAYKSQSVTFSELMYQTTQSASGPNAATGTGGVNARQIGLGVKSGAINTNISTQGASQTTNNPFDIQITGDAFFIVSNGSENFFTRDGSFYVDGGGNLAMTSNGYNVMGWGVDPETMDIRQDNVQPLRIMAPENLTYPPEATSKAYLSGIIDKNDTNVTSSSGKNINLQVYDDLGYSYTVRLNLKSSDTEGVYGLTVGAILDENNEPIDISTLNFGDGTPELTREATAQLGASYSYVPGSPNTITADGKTITLTKEALGITLADAQNTFKVKTDAELAADGLNADAIKAVKENRENLMSAYGVDSLEELNAKVIVGNKPAAGGAEPTATVLEAIIDPAGTQTKLGFTEAIDPAAIDYNKEKIKGYIVNYNPTSGKFENLNDNLDAFELNLSRLLSPNGKSKFSDIEVDMTTTNMFNNSGSSTIAATSGDTKGLGTGRKLGEMSGISIQQNGMIYASYDNGQTKLLGQIAVAEFANASGLEKQGDNLYSATLNSGEFDGIGVDITAGGGYMNTGVLEMSNVDLSAEFTEMITTQRGFQANSRIITVSDTLLEELVNLKR